MLPTGHIATGVLLGLSRRRGAACGVGLAAAVACAVLPDADLAIPALLDRAGIEHQLNTGRHHSWMTHTPLFWSVVSGTAWRAARSERAPRWAPEAARLLAAGSAIHLVGDATANTVALLWPLRRREYGLGLDGMAGVTDHVEYVRRYPGSPAGRLEAGLMITAAAAALSRLRCHWLA